MAKPLQNQLSAQTTEETTLNEMEKILNEQHT